MNNNNKHLSPLLWIDKEGNFYLIENVTGDAVKVDPATGINWNIYKEIAELRASDGEK